MGRNLNVVLFLEKYCTMYTVKCSFQGFQIIISKIFLQVFKASAEFIN